MEKNFISHFQLLRKSFLVCERSSGLSTGEVEIHFFLSSPVRLNFLLLYSPWKELKRPFLLRLPLLVCYELLCFWKYIDYQSIVYFNLTYWEFMQVSFWCRQCHSNRRIWWHANKLWSSVKKIKFRHEYSWSGIKMPYQYLIYSHKLHLFIILTYSFVLISHSTFHLG